MDIHIDGTHEYLTPTTSLLAVLAKVVGATYSARVIQLRSLVSCAFIRVRDRVSERATREEIREKVDCYSAARV